MAGLDLDQPLSDHPDSPVDPEEVDVAFAEVGMRMKRERVMKEEEEEDEAQVDTPGDDDSGSGRTERTSSAGGNGKIFIGGLSWDTTTEKLENHFGKYGDITDAVIMRDRASGTPRGFGFVTFADPGVCDLVLRDKHMLDGRTVECKRSIPRENMVVVKGPKTKKIFVGGIPPSITEEDFKNYFTSYGAVIEHQIMQDHNTGRSRGFGFIVFDSEQTVEDVLAHGRMHELGGKQVEIKKAEPKKAMHDSAGSSYGASRAGYGANGGHYGYGGDGYGVSYGGSYRSGGSSGYGSRSLYGYSSYGYGGGGYAGGLAYGGTGYIGSYSGSAYGSGMLGAYDDGYGGMGYGGGYSGYSSGYGGGSGSYGGSAGYGHSSSRSHSHGSRYHPYSRY